MALLSKLLATNALQKEMSEPTIALHTGGTHPDPSEDPKTHPQIVPYTTGGSFGGTRGHIFWILPGI